MESLPEDLVRMVLSHIASPWVVQVRVVCRQWRRILSCSHFALQWALQMSALHSSSLLSPSPHSLCILSPLLHLSAFHLPSLLSISLSPPPPPPPSSPLLPLAASPLGILFSSLLLFHPLSRLSLRLPPPLSICTPLFAAFGSISSTSFHLLVLGPSLNPSNPYLAAEIFNSVDSTWTTLPSLPALRQTTHIPRSTPSMVWWRDAFFMLWGNQILTIKPSRKHPMKAGSAEELVWGSVGLPADPRIWDARFMTLHVIKDRLFLEGNFQEQGNFHRRHPLRIGVLELDSASIQWKEVGFMPDALSKRLCKQPHPAHCFYTTYSDMHSDHIYFASYWQDTSKTEEASIELVTFDVGERSWSCIPLPTSSNRSALFTSPYFKGLTFHAIPSPFNQSTSSLIEFKGQSQI